MISQTLPGLAIRQAERVSSAEHNRLPNINQSFGPGEGLGIHMDQRLPSICDLLRGIPPPPVQPQHYPAFPPSPLPSPVGASPSLFSSYPNWSALPPRPRSVSGHYPGFLPPPQSLGPRRASADCINTGIRSTTASIPAPTRTPAHTYHHHHHHRASPDRDHNRHRRSSKAAARRRRTSASPSSSFSSSPSDSEPAPTPPTSPESSPTTTTQPQKTTNPQHKQQQQKQTKEKRNNTAYTAEQEAFVIYHRVDLGLAWEQVRAAYMARWPALKRSASGFECAYYRTNANIPAVTGDGLAVLVDLDVGGVGEGAEGGVEGGGAGGAGGGGGDVWQQQQQGGGVNEGGDAGVVVAGDREDVKKAYKYYKGVAYRTRRVPCRKGLYSLMERFPEELVDERHDWVREEHRVLARGVGELHFYLCPVGRV